MLKQIKKKDTGFTIIEVMIVLAIAGLILLIVFLAVPALQRNSRNTGRTSEASRFASAVANFVSNNGGTVPSTKSDVTSITTDFGTFKYFQGLSVPASFAGKMTAGNIDLVAGAIASGTAVASSGNDAILIDTGAVCGAPSQTLTTTAGQTRQIALIYTQESPASNYNEVCIQAE